MSKRDELIILKRSLSADAPVKIHGRTGDTENGSSLLDFVAHSESPEEILLKEDDLKAKKRFEKGFEIYLNRIYTEQEQEFLSSLIFDNKDIYRVDGLLRAKYIPLLQDLQRKAYDNVKPLIKLVRLTKWSGANDFLSTIFSTLKKLNEGFSIEQVVYFDKLQIEKRKKDYEQYLEWKKKHPERRREIARLSSRRRYLFRLEEKVSLSRSALYSVFDELTENLSAWITAKGTDKESLFYNALETVNDKVAVCCRTLRKNNFSLGCYKKRRGITE